MVLRKAVKMSDVTESTPASADAGEAVFEDLPLSDETVSWTAPDGSFTKKILKAGEGLYCPHDGTKCCIVVWLLTDVSLTKEDVGCPIGEKCEVTRGESESLVAEVIDLCLSTMHPGEVCEVTTVIDCPRGRDPSTTVGLRLKLIDFGEDVPSYLMDVTAKHQRVVHHKSRGKELFQKGNIPFAFKRFFRALRCLSTIAFEEAEDKGLGNSIQEMKGQLYTNMAACQLQSGSYAFVVANCTEALRVDPSNIKALFRRAQGWLQLQEFRKAKADLEKARIREPRNLTILESLRQVEAAIAVAAQQQQQQQ